MSALSPRAAVRGLATRRRDRVSHVLACCRRRRPPHASLRPLWTSPRAAAPERAPHVSVPRTPAPAVVALPLSGRARRSRLLHARACPPTTHIDPYVDMSMPHIRGSTRACVTASHSPHDPTRALSPDPTYLSDTSASKTPVSSDVKSLPNRRSVSRAPMSAKGSPGIDVMALYLRSSEVQSVAHDPVRASGAPE